MPEDKLAELYEKVNDRESLLLFVTALSHDFDDGHNASTNDQHTYGLTPNATGWYNARVDIYLDRCVAASEQSGPKGKNPWQECAWIIWGGKDYE